MAKSPDGARKGGRIQAAQDFFSYFCACRGWPRQAKMPRPFTYPTAKSVSNGVITNVSSPKFAPLY
jgi:hypothetical protein